MAIKTYLIGGLAAVALATGLGLYKTEMARARAQGRVEVLSTQIERQVNDYHAFRELVAENDGVRNAELAELRADSARLAGDLLLAQRQARISVSRLDSLLSESGVSDTVTAAVNAAVGALERENEACSLAFKNCQRQLVIQTERIDDYANQTTRADSLIVAQRRLIEQLSQQSGGSNMLPWLIGAGGLGLAVGALLF